MSIEIDNKIRRDQRFAKRNKTEYHVFSNVFEDANAIEQWVGASAPVPVLMDPETYRVLRDRRIEWVFDQENVLVACRIKGKK